MPGAGNMDATARALWRVCRKQAVFTMQIDSKFLIFRSVLGGNLVTVIRKRGCEEKYIDEFHALIEFNEMGS